MRRIDGMIKDERNIGLDFIVHVQNKEELLELISVLEDNDFIVQLNLDGSTLREWMMDIGEEYSYDACFRIRNRKDDKCIAFNPSVEHWRVFNGDILEIRDSKLEFNEGEYSIEAAKIEARKLWEDINDDPYNNVFDLCKDATRDQIVKKIEELVGHTCKEMDISLN